MLVRIVGFHMKEESLDCCVAKVKLRERNGVEWMLLDAPCSCNYLGQAGVYYCRRRAVYFAVKEDKNQLELPFEVKS